MKSYLIKITAFATTLAFIASNAYFLYPVDQASAQAGKASACAAGYITAGISALAAIPQNIIGVSKSQSGDTAQNVTTGGSANSLSFNSCILQPLAKIMIITLIRNIGASVVSWVNSGFQGKPSFVTDLGGTLLDAADQAVGQFIEGTDLGFLCNNFSFQIRIALALKYSQPFRNKSQCSVTKIASNVSNFADNNGGKGWDNWLQVTTQPQNNAYGAYLIADSELSQRAFQAAGIKEKKVSLGQGFLDFETCDEYETAQQNNDRLGITTSDSATPGQYTKTTTANGKTTSAVFSSQDTAPQCTKSSTKTPGTIIASKLSSTLGQSDIQAAVATEIDDVIAATMNQLAQKIITGASGLLGMSQKSSSNTTQSYISKYQQQLYGTTATSTTVANTSGATSPVEDYTVANYDAASKLVQNDQQVNDIYGATDQAATQAVQQTRTQQDAINATLNVNSATSAQNIALLKSASESSNGGGAASNAVNGITDGNVTQYNPPSVTGGEANPWWEVDLGDSKAITEIHIWRVTNEPVANTMGTIRVIASNGAGQDEWTSSPITPTDAGANPIVVPVNLTRRYIRIEAQSNYNAQCRATGYSYGEVQFDGCYYPLKLAEVEVIGAPLSAANATSTSAFGTISSGSGSTQTTTTDTTPATIGLIAAASIGTLSSSAPLTYELHVTSDKAVSGLTVTSSLKSNDTDYAFLNLFSSLNYSYGKGSVSAAYNVTSNSAASVEFDNVSIDAGSYYVLKLSGPENSSAQPGTYTLITTVKDSSGNVVKTDTADFVVQ